MSLKNNLQLFKLFYFFIKYIYSIRNKYNSYLLSIENVFIPYINSINVYIFIYNVKFIINIIYYVQIEFNFLFESYIFRLSAIATSHYYNFIRILYR